MNRYWLTKFIWILSFILLLVGCVASDEDVEKSNENLGNFEEIEEVEEIEEITEDVDEEIYEEIDVIMSLDIEDIQGKIVVHGSTNLPDRMQLMISISNENDYLA